MLNKRELLKDCGALVLIAGLVMILYGHTLAFGFAYDDELLVEKNLYIKDARCIGAYFTKDTFQLSLQPQTSMFYRPLLLLSFFLDHARGGPDAAVFHMTNLALFVIASFLVYAFIKEVCGSAGLAALAAIIFAGHPINAQSASWISGRNESLYLIFGLISFILFARSAGSIGPSVKRVCLYLGSALAFLLSLLCKETALFLLLVLAWYDLCFMSDFKPGRFIKNIGTYVPYITIVILYLSARYAALGGTVGIGVRYLDSPASPAAVLAFTIKSIPYYIKSLIFPFPIEIQAFKIPTPLPLDTAGAVSMVLLICFLIYYFHKYGLSVRKEIFLLGWAAIASIHILFVATLMGARFLAFPLIGIGGFSVIFAARRIDRTRSAGKTLPSCLLLMLIASYLVSSYQASLPWKDNRSLFDLMLKKHPNDFDIHYNLGYMHTNKGDFAAAAKEYERALELKPDHKYSRFNLAHAYYNIGRPDDALVEFKKLAARHTLMPYVHQAMAAIYADKRRYDEAMEEVKYELSLGTGNYRQMLQFLSDLYEKNGETENSKKINLLAMRYC